MIETRLLYYFLTVAREGNITKAACTLHITQPTLSRQMTFLEEEVGAQLFVRKNRPLTLTNEGILLRRRAEEVLALLEKTEEEISNPEEQMEGTIAIGCGELASVELLTNMMTSFNEKYPKVKFDIYTANADQIKQRIDHGLTDIGLLLEPVDMEHYEYVRMPEKEKWVVLTPSNSIFAKKESVCAKDLVQVPVIMPFRQKMHDELANWFGDTYENLHIAGMSNLSTNAAYMVHSGMGHALIVEGGLPFLEMSDICMRPLEPRLVSTSVLAWKRNQPFSKAVQCFILHIKCFLGMEKA